jgi:hypothetical protein
MEKMEWDKHKVNQWEATVQIVMTQEKLVAKTSKTRFV